jgi:hypothetical protein
VVVRYVRRIHVQVLGLCRYYETTQKEGGLIEEENIYGLKLTEIMEIMETIEALKVKFVNSRKVLDTNPAHFRRKNISIASQLKNRLFCIFFPFSGTFTAFEFSI